MKAYYETNLGKLRNNNEDAFFVSDAPIGPCDALYIVADGMGGHQAGEIASKEAVSVFSDLVENLAALTENPGETFFDLLQQTNNRICDMAFSDQRLAGMGTTFVMAAFVGEEVYVMNIGDSRCYGLFEDGEFKQLTEDHSLVQALINRGVITKEEARTHPKKNVILRALGVDYFIHADMFIVPKEQLKALLLCSDGLSSMVTDEYIKCVLETEKKPLLAHALVSAALDAGGQDNVTVIVVA